MYIQKILPWEMFFLEIFPVEVLSREMKTNDSICGENAGNKPAEQQPMRAWHNGNNQ